MKVNWIRSIACTLGAAVVLPAASPSCFAQSGQYVAPSYWNQFNKPANNQSPAGGVAQDPASPQYRVASAPVRPAGQPQQQFAPQPAYPQSMPRSLAGGQYPAQPNYSAAAPVGQPAAAPNYRVANRMQYEGEMYSDGGGVGSGYVEQIPAPSAMQTHSPYMSAASAPWEGSESFGGSCATGNCGSGGCMTCAPARPDLFPWFGGASVLFWQVENPTGRRLVLETGMPSTSYLDTGDVDAEAGIGYDLFFGRYFGCGKYAVSANYLNFDPDRETATYTGTAGDSYVSMPAWSSVGFYDDHTDPASTFTSMKSLFDSMPTYEVSRDLSFQGVEVNMWSFGFGGARRLAPACGTGLGGCNHGGQGHSGYGHGGFGGPLQMPCAATCQTAFLHGFRWFQIEDDFRLGVTDGTNAASFDSSATNNLFGYQVGSRWSWCATNRINLGVGTKVGVYANDVEVQHRIGNAGMPARYQSDNVASRVHVNERSRATVLAGLGELDLGTGVRLTDKWTFRCGYRVLATSGVATTVGMFGHEMFSANLNARDVANDSMILHGAYVGTELNW